MAKLENQMDSVNSNQFDLDPHSDAMARERNRLICSTGIGMNKNYSSDESEGEEKPPTENPDIDDFMEFLLGMSEDSPFYDSKSDIRDACETYGAEGKSTFFESKPLDSPVYCKIEPLAPTKPKAGVFHDQVVSEVKALFESLARSPVIGFPFIDCSDVDFEPTNLESSSREDDIRPVFEKEENPILLEEGETPNLKLSNLERNLPTESRSDEISCLEKRQESSPSHKSCEGISDPISLDSVPAKYIFGNFNYQPLEEGGGLRYPIKMESENPIFTFGDFECASENSLCVVCGLRQASTCLDINQPGLDQEFITLSNELPQKWGLLLRSLSPEFRQVLHTRHRLHPDRSQSLEKQLFFKKAKPVKWDTQPWRHFTTAQYRNRQILAGINPDGKLERFSGSLKEEPEIEKDLFSKHGLIQPVSPTLIDQEGKTSSVLTDEISSPRLEELYVFPCMGGNPNGSSFRKTIKPWPEAEDYLQASVMLKEIELSEGPNPWTNVQGCRLPSKTRQVVSNLNPAVLRTGRSVRFQDRVWDLGTLD